MSLVKQWYDFDRPQDYRKARAEGTHGFNRLQLNDQARLVYATGRDGQRIELRVIEPPGPSKGVFLQFHAGGFVTGSNSSYDGYLTRLSGESGGAWFAVAVALELRDKHKIDVKSQIAAICAGYGIIFMAAKWINAGSAAELHVVEGACHAFTLFPLGEVTELGIKAVVDFLHTQLKRFTM
ncbi:related to lipase/esterase [Fusarium fujikuroi]|nr:related to lipase/esterase [Fusarium fujikuroi]